MILDRFLSSSMVYPTDYGFLIGHRGPRRGPARRMVCVSEATFPGCVIPVKPIALFKMHDEKGEDDKIVCVPTHDPGWNTAESLDDIRSSCSTRSPTSFPSTRSSRARTSRSTAGGLARRRSR